MSVKKMFVSDAIAAATTFIAEVREEASAIVADTRAEAVQVFSEMRTEAAAALAQTRAEFKIAREEVATFTEEVRQAVADMRDETASLAHQFWHDSEETYQAIRKASRMGVVSCNRQGNTYVLLKDAEKSVVVETLDGMHIKRGTPVFVVRTADGVDVACPTTESAEKLEWLVVGIFNSRRGV